MNDKTRLMELIAERVAIAKVDHCKNREIEQHRIEARRLRVACGLLLLLTLGLSYFVLS